MNGFDCKRLNRLLGDLVDFGKEAYPDVDSWHVATLPAVTDRIITEYKAAQLAQLKADAARAKADRYDPTDPCPRCGVVCGGECDAEAEERAYAEWQAGEEGGEA
jgi:hypothetical protein